VGQWLYSEGRSEDVIIMPDWKMPFPLRCYCQGEIPIEIIVCYWDGLASLEEWTRTCSRLWTVCYGRPESQPLPGNLGSFAVCERRDLQGLTAYICPGSEETGAQGPGMLTDRGGVPSRPAVSGPACS